MRVRRPILAPSPRGRRLLAAGAIAVTAIVAAGAWALWRDRAPDAGTASSSRPTRIAPAPVASNRIVLTNFANQSSQPDDAWLGEGLPEMLTTDLVQSKGLEVISTQKLYDLLSASGRTDLTTLDRRTATRLARWAGAGVVISGSIFRSGSTYRIDVQAHDTGEGQVIAAARVEGSDVFKMADELAARLRQGLQIAATEDRGIETMTTSSAEAYRAFTAGMDAYDELRFSAAADHFRGALAVDVAYATAQLRLGMSLLLDGEAGEAAAWFRRAARETARMSPRDRLLAQALAARYVDGDDGLAAQGFDQLERLNPGDVEAHVWRGLSSRAGSMRVIKALRRAFDLDPNHPLAVAALVAQLDALGLSDDAEAILGDFLARNPAVAEGPIRDLDLSAPGDA